MAYTAQEVAAENARREAAGSTQKSKGQQELEAAQAANPGMKIDPNTYKPLTPEAYNYIYKGGQAPQGQYQDATGNMVTATQPYGTLDTTPVTSPQVPQPTTQPTAQQPGLLPYDEALKNLQGQGLTGQALSNATTAMEEARAKYTGAVATKNASGEPAPSSASDGGVGIRNAIAPQAKAPDTSVADAFVSEDPIFTKVMQAFAEFMSPPKQTESLVSEYQNLIKSSGLDSINTELINTQKIIDGTEYDIRNEVTAAGGFASDSQVLALASARNKSLIKNYNTLLATRDNLQQQVSTMMQLSSQDRQMANQRVEQQLNLGFKLLDYRDKFQQNARDNYNNIIKVAGYKGLWASANGDPYTIGLIENTLGLQSGGLAQLANLESTPTTKPIEVSPGATLYDPTTGKAIYTAPTTKQPSGGGGGGGGGGTLSPIAQSVVNNPSLFYNFTPTQKGQIISELQAGGYDISKLQNSKLTATQQDDIAQMNTVTGLIDNVLSYNTDGKLEGIGAFGSGTLKSWLAQAGFGSEEGKSVRALIGNIQGTIAKLRGGTSFTPNEQRLLETYTPTINDNPSVAIIKFNLLKDFINSKNTNLVSAAGTNITTGQIQKKGSTSNIDDLRKKYNY